MSKGRWNAAWGAEPPVDDRIPLRMMAPAMARAAYIAGVFFASGLVYVGGSVLAAFGAHVWHQGLVNFNWACGMVASVPVLIVALLLAGWVHGWQRATCFAAVAVALAGSVVFTCVLRSALDLQALRDRGIIEVSVVSVEHVYTPVDPGPGNPDTYSYTLRALDGPPIRRDTAWSAHRFAVGEHITVLSDPAGEATPSLQLHVSADGAWLETGWTAGVAIICLGVAAWTAPRPVRYRTRLLR